MFTGIIETTGEIAHIRTVPGGRRLGVRGEADWNDIILGASIAVNGVCLTVAAMQDNLFEFDLITETLDRTTLAACAVGDRVNLERSLRVGDRVDGHFVQGHVDGAATVTRIVSNSRESVVWLRTDEALRPCIIPKGGITIDGVSLTIAAVRGDQFSVALIPTTLQRTTLEQLKIGDRVNIETDIITRTVVHQLAALQSSPGLTVELLREVGFP